jgi:endoglucanase
MKQTVFIWMLLATAAVACAASPTTDIRLDQAGYLPGMPKLAMVVAKVPAKDFSIRKASDGTVVFLGRLTDPVEDGDSGDRVQAADFTRFTRNGTYFVEVPGVGRSWDFSIAPDVYNRAYYLAMRSFYGQRCGTTVDLGSEFPGYTHAACHLEGSYHVSSGKSGPRKTTGGWHDAGDYGRYTVNSGITTGTLLWTWELFGPKIGKISLNVPESGNPVPDILDEIRWNLDWMFSMQDADGGVWQKQTSLGFCGFMMPEKDKLVSYVIGTGKEPFKSTCATADFAAVMAIAARVYRPFDAAYSERCLKAAKRAWMWVEKYPNVTFRNPSGVSTGAYGDPNCGDELLWASAELSRTTAEEVYHRYFLAHYTQYRETVKAVPAEGWANVAPLGLWTYVLGGGKDAAAANAIRQDAVDAADRFVERTNRNGYRISMVPADYIWGSNGVAANYGMQLLVANAINPDSRYVQTALENLHYLLGKNTFSLSWVTQVGAHPYRHPHHRPSGADSLVEPWPGLLSGGPNQNRQDGLTKNLPQLPPAKIYVDEEASYASNETCINWNAPLVFILASVLPEK